MSSITFAANGLKVAVFEKHGVWHGGILSASTGEALTCITGCDDSGEALLALARWAKTIGKIIEAKARP